MLTALVEKVVRHEDVTEDEAAGAMREVMEGRAAPASLGALLAVLVMKGERPAELVGFDGDAPAKAIIEAQDRAIAEASGRPRGPIKTIRRSAVRK